jgi:hypothetical protein
MKKIGYSYITLLFMLSSCSATISEKRTGSIGINDTVKEIKTFKKWTFKVNNKDFEKIGYKIYTDDQSIGVKALYPEGEYVYITDVYHTNIKQINVNTGEMKSSKSLSPLPADESGIWLRDIAVFNNKIYAPADRDTTYIYSKELKLLQSIPTSRGNKYIESVGQNEIKIYLNSNQLPDMTIEKTLLSINKEGTVSTIKKDIPIEERTKQLEQRQVQDKPFKTYTKNGKNYFECEYGIIELKTSIPEIKEYDCVENFNFNSNTLVYFDSTPTEFTLYVYKY